MKSFIKKRDLTLVLLFAAVASLFGQNLLDEQGRKTGPWKVEYPNGKILYEATFHAGRPVGEMVRYYESGAVRARMKFDSLEDRSFTRLYYKNGKPAAEGWHVNKVKDSVWTYFSEFDGTIRIREPYQGGDLYGVVKSYYSSGEVSEEVTWQQNLKMGPWKQYYEDGSLRLESRYEKDQLQGNYELFYKDSTTKVLGAYLDDRSHGTWSFFDETGMEVYAIEYENGRAVDQEKYLQLMEDSLKQYEVISEPESIQQY